MATQFVKFTKHKGDGFVWVITQEFAFAETFEKTEGGKAVKGTIIHLKNKEKVWVKEHPDEINSILRKLDVDPMVEDLRKVVKKHSS